MSAPSAKLKRAKLKPWKIGDVVDGWRLRVQLTAAAHDNLGNQIAQRARALELLKGALFRGRMIAKERLEAGAGGIDCAELLAAVQDEVISALFDFATKHIFRVHNRTAAEKLAICATGGYGRMALAPSSDIDILFIRPAKDASWAESVIEYVPVSYTHLDVYKRQVYHLITQFSKTIIHPNKNTTTYISIRYNFGNTFPLFCT